MSPKTIFLILTRISGLFLIVSNVAVVAEVLKSWELFRETQSFQSLFMPALSRALAGICLILLGPLFAFGFPEAERWETKVNAFGLTVIGIRVVGFYFACHHVSYILGAFIPTNQKPSIAPDLVGVVVYLLLAYFAPQLAALLPGSKPVVSVEAVDPLPPESS